MLILSSQDPEVGILGLGRFQLSFGLRDCFVGAETRVLKTIGEIQRILIGSNRGV
jgi:hypothetical protein